MSVTPTLVDRVELSPTEDLIPYSNNPKEHPDEQVRAIASSIKNYGWDQPIVVDGDGEIIKGHGRMQAAELLGLDRVPVIRRDDLTDAEARAARIADNKTAESEWDSEILNLEIERLLDDPIDIDTLGFDDAELDSLLGELSMDDEDIQEAFGSLPDGERDDIRQKAFMLSSEQYDLVERAVEQAQHQHDLTHPDNPNDNGNAIAHICREYVDG